MALLYTTWSEVQRVHDSLSNNKFRLFIPDVNGIKMSDMFYRVKSLNIPLSEEANVQEIGINGFVVRKSTGDTKHPSSFSVKIVDDSKMTVRERFKMWKEYCAETLDGKVQVGDDSYKKDLEVYVYTNDKRLIATYVVPGAWPTKINEISLESTQSPSDLEVDIEFCIDRAAYIKGSSVDLKN